MILKDIHKIKNILIINPFGIGDVLFTTPLIKAFRDNFPNSVISYLCNKRTAPILETNPYINEMFIYEKDDYRKLWQESRLGCIGEFIKLILSIKRRSFDLVVDLSLGRHYNFALWLLGTKRRVGFNYKNRGLFLTTKIDIDGYHDKHVVEYYLDFLRFLGITPKTTKLELFLKDEDLIWADKFLSNNQITSADLIVGIAPAGGASWGENSFCLHWKRKGFAEVADTLIDTYKAKVIFFGDLKEISICNEIASLMRNKPILSCGITTLRQFAALLKKCKVLICNDTGPLHVAVASGVKVVCICGPVDEGVYGPYADKDTYRIVKKDLTCRPCYQKFKMPRCLKNLQCLEEISPVEVLEKVEELI